MDVRFIYVHHIDWYLSIQDKKESFETILPNDIDLAGWELRKALLLFRKSNPPLLEWLRSPIVYKKMLYCRGVKKSNKNIFQSEILSLPLFYMARGNYEAYFKTEEVLVKKYFYVLRPILACAWIERKNEMAPMEFEILLGNEITHEKLIKKIKTLLKRKRMVKNLTKEKELKPLTYSYWIS